MEGIKIAYTFWVRKVKEKSYCEGCGVNGQMRIKRMVKEREWKSVS